MNWQDFRQKFIEAARPWRRGSCGRDALCVVHAVPRDALCVVHAVPRDALCAVPCLRSAPVLARHTVLVAAARSGPVIGGGARGGGAGGSFGAHAATSAKADAMIIGLANCTTALSYRVATHLKTSWAFHSTKRKERARACFRVARDYRAKLACPAGSF